MCDCSIRDVDILSNFPFEMYQSDQQTKLSLIADHREAPSGILVGVCRTLRRMSFLCTDICVSRSLIHVDHFIHIPLQLYAGAPPVLKAYDLTALYFAVRYYVVLPHTQRRRCALMFIEARMTNTTTKEEDEREKMVHPTKCRWRPSHEHHLGMASFNNSELPSSSTVWYISSIQYMLCAISAHYEQASVLKPVAPEGVSVAARWFSWVSCY